MITHQRKTLAIAVAFAFIGAPAWAQQATPPADAETGVFCDALHLCNTAGERRWFQPARQILSMLVPPGAPIGSPQVMA